VYCIFKITPLNLDLKRDAFHTSPPAVYVLVAELELSSPGPVSSELYERSPLESESENKRIIGYALYYKTYSAWKGKALHMEDLFVRPEYRSKGVGEKILKYLGQVALDGDYAKISFECIDWNELAMKFYNKHGAVDSTVLEYWESYRFNNDALKKLVPQQ